MEINTLSFRWHDGSSWALLRVNPISLGLAATGPTGPGLLPASGAQPGCTVSPCLPIPGALGDSGYRQQRQHERQGGGRGSLACRGPVLGHQWLSHRGMAGIGWVGPGVLPSPHSAHRTPQRVQPQGEEACFRAIHGGELGVRLLLPICTF